MSKRSCSFIWLFLLPNQPSIHARSNDREIYKEGR